MQSLVRSVITIAAGKLNPETPPREFLEHRWGEEARSIETVIRAASSPAMTSVPQWAGMWATTTQAFVAALVGVSAGADLLRRALSLRLDGVGTINIPALAVPLADFVGESALIPVVSGTSSIQATLQGCKFAVITTLTRETVESSNGEPLIRDALLSSAGPALDRRLFDSNAAVAGLRPAGLLHGKSALTPSADSNKLAAMIADLAALGAAVAPFAGNGGLLYVAAARQALAINLGVPKEFPYPLLTSTSLAAGTVICLAISALVSAAGAGPLIDTTRAASLQMNDAPSGDLMTGGNVIGTFQSDVLGLRMRWPLGWTLRDPGAVAFMSNVSWTS
jgi:hypothetical protein